MAKRSEELKLQHQELTETDRDVAVQALASVYRIVIDQGEKALLKHKVGTLDQSADAELDRLVAAVQSRLLNHDALHQVAQGSNTEVKNPRIRKAARRGHPRKAGGGSE